MKFVLRTAALAAFALALAGCYETSTPLITAANADYPLEETVRYSYESDLGEPRVGQIWRDGDRYVMRGDADEDGDGQSILFYHAQNDLYVVQRGHLTDEAFHYDLVRIVDDAVSRFDFDCEANYGPDYVAVQSGVLTRGTGDSSANCYPNDIDTLAQLLIARAENATPKIVYTLNPEGGTGVPVRAPIATGDTNVDGIDFGDNSSVFANNGQCDDPRFEGTGMASLLLDMDIRGDATDCMSGYRSGQLTLESAAQAPATQVSAAQAPATQAPPVQSNAAPQTGSFTAIGPGQTISGALDAGDALNDGTSYDAYRFKGAAGQSVTIDMTADELDTYLMLFRSNDMANEIASDDDGGEGLNARLTHTLPAGDEYVVFATSAYQDDSGNYQISLGGVASTNSGASGDVIFEGINFGADSSQWANDDECDDPRFEGAGMTSTTLLDEDIRADATDCLNAYRAGNLQVK
jgi:hypothetical protein